MNEVLPVLSAAALDALASAVERGALVAPFGAMQIGRHVAKGEQADALRLIGVLQAAGLDARTLVAVLRLAEAARNAGEAKPQPVLVWSDLDIAGSRDTSVVCNELFRGARESVVVSTFNLGHKAKDGEAKGNPVELGSPWQLADFPTWLRWHDATSGILITTIPIRGAHPSLSLHSTHHDPSVSSSLSRKRATSSFFPIAS